MKTTDNILIIDLEATCWNDRPPRGQESEIIEIGVCIMNAKTGKISQNEGILVKPQFSKVSPFCTELTSITQQMLDNEGVLLEDALDILRAEYDSEDLTWASYGNYDLNMLQNQARRFNLDYPLSDEQCENFVRRTTSDGSQKCRNGKSFGRTESHAGRYTSQRCGRC